MLHLISLLVLLLPQVSTRPAPQATTRPAADEGPLRIELDAMREVRTLWRDSAERSTQESNFFMQFRVRGADLARLSRHGDLILTEMVDDTGHSLIEADAHSEADKLVTHPNRVPTERLLREGLMRSPRAKPAARGAKTLKRIRGTIRLILADQTEMYTIDNPLQYYGKTIDDPRLKELGLEIRVVPFEEFETALPANRCLVLQYKTKAEHVHKATFFDGRMRLVQSRARPMATRAGAACTLYNFVNAGALTDELQLVLEVHPEIEDLRLPFEAEDVELP